MYEGRPLRRVFFASTMGMATAAACYPQQAIEKANLSYGKVLSFFTDWKSNSDSEQLHKHVNLSGLPDTVDDEQKPKEKSPEKMKETDVGGEFHVRHILVLKFYDVEIFCFFSLPSYHHFFFHSGMRDSDNFIPGYEYIASAIIDELSNAVKGWGVAVEELENMAHVILKEIMAGINEDINIQTGGWVGQEHKPQVVLDGKDLVRRIANEVLEAIEADMNVQTGGRLEQKRELCLESKHLAKSIVDSIMKEVEYDIKQGESDAPYLFSLRDELRKLAIKMFENEIYQASMGIGRNVKRIHVNVDMLSETVGRQLKERIEELYIRSNCAGEFDDREVAIIDFQEIRKSVTGGLGKYLSDHSLVTPHAKENSVHVVKDWGELTKRVVNAMTRAFQNDIETETRRLETTKKPSIVIDARNLVLSVVEEITEAIQEDIDIQTGKGFRSEEANVRDEKPVGDDPGQSEPEDKVMYSTRSR